MFFFFGNFWVYYDGLYNYILKKILVIYLMRLYYVWLVRIGMVSWFFSVVFYIRDFRVMEELDYFVVGVSVFYGMYYIVVRVFWLDRVSKMGVRKLWMGMCVGLYLVYVGYLKGVGWDYGYNMGVNVVVGVV